MRQALEADGISNLGDIAGPIQKQLGGLLESDLSNQRIGRQPGIFDKTSTQLPPTYHHPFRQFIYTEVWIAQVFPNHGHHILDKYRY